MKGSVTWSQFGLGMGRGVSRLFWLFLFLLGGSPWLQAQVDTTIVQPTGNQLVTLGNSLTFLADSNVRDGVTFNWTVFVPDQRLGEEFTGASMTYQFSELGNYRVEVAASNEDGETDSTPASLNVMVIQEADEIDTAISSSTNSPVLEVGQSISLEASATGGSGGYSFTWSATGAGVNPTQAAGSAVSFRFTEPGSATISCTARDSGGNVDATPAVLVVTVNPVVEPIETSIVSPTTPPTVPAGTTLSFRASATGGDGNYQFDWTANGPGVSPAQSSGASVSFRFNEPGNYGVACRASDGSNGVDATPATLAVRVEAQPDPIDTTIDASNGSSTVTLGGSLTFRATATGGDGDYGFEWQAQGPGVTPTQAEGSTVSFTFNEPGTVQILCAAKDGSGAIDETPASVTIRVEARVEAIETTIDTSGGAFRVTAGGSLGMRASATGGNGNYSFEWQAEGAGVSPTQNQGSSVSFTFNESGTVQISCRARDNEGLVDETPAVVSVRVDPVQTDPVKTEITAPAAGSVYEVGAAVSFSATASGGNGEGYTFDWELTNGSLRQTFSGRTVSARLEIAGTYTMRCVATDSAGLRDQEGATLSVTTRGVVDTAIVGEIPTELFVGQSLQLSATASGGSEPYSFEWNLTEGNAGGGSFEGSSVVIPLTAPGSYSLVCRATDSQGVADATPAQVSFVVREETNDTPVETSLNPSGSLEVALGQSLTFEAAASGGSGQGYSFNWAISSPERPSVRQGDKNEILFDIPGTWRIAVTAMDSERQSDTSPATAQVTVLDNNTDAVVTTIEPAGELRADLGESMSFRASASGGSGEGYSYDWEVTSPFTTRSFSGQSIGLEFTAEGVWTIRCVAKDGAGTVDPNGATARVTVGGTSNEPVETTITAPQGPVSIQPGTAVAFSATASGGSGTPYRFFWAVSGPGDLPAREAPEVSYTFERPGEYVVRCVAQDSSGVRDETAAEVVVRVAEDGNTDAVDTAIVSPTQTRFNLGDSARFSATAQGGVGEPYDFSWVMLINGEPKTFEGADFEYTFEVAGNYQVTCVARDGEGNVDATPALVRLEVQDGDGNNAPDTKIVSPEGPVRVALGESVTFTAEADGGAGGPYDYTWVLQGSGLSGSTQEGNPVTFTFTEPGTFTLGVSARDAEGTRDTSPATTTISVEGEVPGVETTIVRPGTNVTAPEGSSVLFEAAAEGGEGRGYTFLWRVLDANNRTIDELRGNPVPVDFPTAGRYGVSVAATDGAGNEDPTPATALVTVERGDTETLVTKIVQPLENLTVPIGERVELVAEADGGTGAPYRFEWVIATPTGVSFEDSGSRIGLTLEDPGTYTFTCTAYDSENNPGQPAVRAISVGRGDTELDTRIAEPTQAVVETRVNETVTFRAESDGETGTNRVFFDWRLLDAGGRLVDQFSGQVVYVSVKEPGNYVLEVAARGGDGSRDETPASRALVVNDRDDTFNTVIVEPTADFETEVGAEHLFVADVEGGSSEVRFTWLVTRNGSANVADTYTGREIRLLFDSAGDYSVFCQATDANGQVDTSPDSRRVRVIDPNDGGDAAVAIVEPTADVTAEPGALVTFRAESTGETEVTQFKWALIEETTGAVIRRFSGSRISVDFPVPGSFRVVCEGFTERGTATAAVARQVTISEADGGPLQVRIVSPGEDVRVETGAVVTFSAELTGGEGTINWERLQAGAQTNTQSATGNTASWAFEQAGIYEVVALALDANGTIQDGDRRRVEVTGLGVRIVSPAQREVRLRVGETVTFKGEVTAGGSVQEPYWYFGADPETRSFGDSYSTAFETAGTYQLFFEMQSAGGQTATDFRWIEVAGEEPLEVAILSPGQDSLFAVHEQFDLVAEISGAGDEPLETVWVVNGEAYEGGSRVEDVSIDVPGNYTVVFEALRPRDGLIRADTIQVNVYDPERALIAEIVEPFTDLQLQVGDSVYFEAVTNGTTLGEELTERWEIVNLADGSVVASGPRLGNRAFAQAGSFEVRFIAQTATNQSNVATRRIDVGNFDNTAFSSNDAPERAAGVKPGRYAEIALDRSHYFSVTLTGDTQNLQVDNQIDGTADVTVYRVDAMNQLFALRSLRVSGNRGFTVADLTAGTYLIEFTPVAAGKLNLSFGFAVTVLTPSLYFADVNETDAASTSFGVVNPGNSSAVVELVGYDGSGNIIAEATREIVGNGKLTGDAKAFFGDDAEGVAWIVAQSTKNLQGYSRTESRDGQEAYATSAATKLASELYVPHIAQKTNNWYTRADIINGGANASSGSQIQAAGNNQASLNVVDGFSKDRFRFTEKWDGALPTGAVWARLKETNEQIALAGTEVFGRVDGVRHVAGLSLFDAERDNPNFTYVRQNIYFTHIARDTGQFWTGIALVNIDTVPASMIVRGYGPDGGLVGQKTLTLAAEEKIVELAEQFLVDIGSPANVDWVEIETDSGIVGYELFGTHDGARLAGFEASTSLKTELCFPIVEAGNRWQGISVINVNDSEVTLTFTLFSAAGDVMATRAITSAGKQKVLATVRDLFQLDKVPAAGGWVGLTATAPVAGFELFGNQGGSQMSALKAQ